MPAGKDYYAILGVARDASEEAMKKAYRKLAVKWHPDKHASKSDAEKAAAAERFKDIAEAYTVLTDKEKREVYDRFGEQGLKTGASSAQSGMGGAGMGGVFPGGGGMPGRMSFSFSSSGPGMQSGMDNARAARIFEAFFAGGDPFSETGGQGGLGGFGSFGGLSSFGGGGMPSSGMPRRSHQAASALTASDVLPPGTAVKLAELSNTALIGEVGTIESFDRQTQRYTVCMASTGNNLAVKPQNVQQIVSEATVVGTSQKELNGRIVPSATYDAASKRYRVEGLTPDGKTLALRPENVLLPEHTQVTIEGVQSRPALNGKRGRIVNVDAAINRYVVTTGEEQIKLRIGSVVAAC